MSSFDLFLFCVAAGALSACSGDASPAGSSTGGGGGAGGRGRVTSVDLGGGTSASLGSDGAVSIVHDGHTIAGSKGAAFGVFRDTANPNGFHDPTQAGTVWKGVAAQDVSLDSPMPGVLHLVLSPQGADSALVSFALALDDGAYLGLGERFDHVDAKGRVVPMFLEVGGNAESATNDAHVPVPFFVDSKGYGVFVASRQAGAFDVGANEEGVVRAAFEGDSLEVFVYAPATADPIDAVRSYTMQTGAPRVPPLWAFAPMHWRNEWTDAETLFSDLDEYRTRHIPASTVWLDNPWETSYNDATLDETRFGDAATLMSGIAARGFKTIAWSTPYLQAPTTPPNDAAQNLWVEADAKKYFVQQSGKTWAALGCCVDGDVGMMDFTSPKASAFWSQILGNATGIGIEGFKLDYGEDLVTSLLGARLAIELSDGESERTSRSYPLGYDDAYRAALDAAHTPGFLIGRASSYGGQSHLDAIWPGDLDNGFEVRTSSQVGGLPAAIVAAQSLASSGFPTFGSDTGGFRNGAPTREALLRWAEHTAFSVILQLGGGGDSHNPWSYDEQAATIYGGLATQHMQLVPYLAGLVNDAHATGSPSIRSLPLAFPSDESGLARADDEYMLGADLLVAPVVTAGATSRGVHAPPGDWVHWFTGETIHGPTDATVSAPLGSPPVFARAGSVLPLYPADVDTLVDATQAGITTLGSRAADVEARAFATTQGNAAWPEGSTLRYTATTGSLAVTWDPKAPVEHVFVAIDLRLASFTGAAPHELKVDPSLTELTDEASVRASTTSAFAVASTGDTLWISLMSPGTFTFTHGA